jgi:hypothetical protein
MAFELFVHLCLGFLIRAMELQKTGGPMSSLSPHRRPMRPTPEHR